MQQQTQVVMFKNQTEGVADEWLVVFD